MSPKLADVLKGQVAALAAPLPPEAGGDYLASRLGMVAMLAALAAQEAERGVAARVLENTAMAELFSAAAAAYDEVLEGRLAKAARQTGDLTLTALDARNAELREVLIELHEKVEALGDSLLDREILALYRAMASARRVDLPSTLTG